LLIEEARWFGDSIRELASRDPDLVFPMCNLGSSSGHFRTVDQPWIEQRIFGPLRRDGQEVVHVDLKAAEGVDAAGDVLDEAFHDQLRRQGFRSILCSNVLEHVRDPRLFARRLVELVPVGGYLFVSCPYRYPYHADPLDNGLRVGTAGLAALFPGLDDVREQLVVGATAAAYVAGPAHAGRASLRLLMPFYRPRRWLTTFSHLLWLRRKFEISCLVLKRSQGPT
jgi:hypothetical protein